jgi:20S proteasome subunit alpha 2
MSDYSLTTFGQSGELTQVRYALTAVGNGETCLGIRAKNGVVIACEKKLTSVLIDETTIHKVDKIAPYLGVTYSGIGPDFNAVLCKARKDVQVYHSKYQDRITPFMICRQVADLFQEYTQNGGVRPFGIGLIVAGYDEEQGPQIFQIEASGTFYCWKATALGKSSSAAKGFLEKRYSDDLDIEDAIHTAILTLKDSFEGELTEKNIEIGVIRTSDPNKEFKVLSQGEIRDYLREVE